MKLTWKVPRYVMFEVLAKAKSKIAVSGSRLQIATQDILTGIKRQPLTRLRITARASTSRVSEPYDVAQKWQNKLTQRTWASLWQSY